MRFGFRMTGLRLTGKRVPDADVRFEMGLNVICGPSDTGKTFIAQCVDYMCGASDPPKQVPEAEQYDSVFLGIRSRETGEEFTLERGLRGGDCRLTQTGGPVRVLAAKHSAGNSDSISHFLLSLSGLADKAVRKNALGVTRTVSFRDVCRLALVDEETVISERSPIASGQVIHKTVERNVFRLLLTGVDDSGVIATLEPQVDKLRQQGRTDVVKLLIDRARRELVVLDPEPDLVVLRGQVDRAESLFADASKALADEQLVVAVLEEQRQRSWEQVRTVESRSAVLLELQGRFELLADQYQSDLRRLESISEVGARLNQMPEGRCPVCGAQTEHQSHQHRQNQVTPDVVAASCRAEAAKIRGLISDLMATRSDSAVELDRLSEAAKASTADLARIATELTHRVQPRVKVALERFRESQTQRDRAGRAISVHERIAELEGLLAEAGKPVRSKERVSAAVTAGEAEAFSQEAERLLREWRFPALERVTFSETDQDLVISGRARASHGKGIRAVTHAAFNLALLRYCLNRSMPHPGFVLVDSPLVVYREPDPGEGGFTPDVKNAFYSTLATGFSDAQVVILENEDPPAGLDATANVIRFTATTTGRPGFIPAPPSSDE